MLAMVVEHARNVCANPRTRRNKAPSDKLAADVQASICETNGGMGIVLILFLVDEHPAAVALLDVPALERCELAAAQGAAQKHRQNRPVPFSLGGLDLRLSEQVARHSIDPLTSNLFVVFLVWNRFSHPDRLVYGFRDFFVIRVGQVC
jgi:hypothetical protein